MLFVVSKGRFDESAGWARIVRHYAVPEGVHDRSFGFEDIRARFVWADHPYARYTRYAESEAQAAFLTHVPYGYSKCVAARPDDPDFPLQMGRVIKAVPEKISDLTAPAGVITSDKRSYLRIAIDGVGLARIFYVRTPRGIVLSNRPEAALLYAGIKAEPSEEGWACQMTQGWFAHGLTAYEGVRYLTYGDYVTLTPDDVGFASVNAMRLWKRSSRDVFDGLRRMMAEVSQTVHMDQWSAPLSGGRDSRMTAAILTNHFGDCLKLYTSYPPLLERDVAQQLVERLPYFTSGNETEAMSGSRRIWATNEKRASGSRKSLMERASSVLDSFEGQALATHSISGVWRNAFKQVTIEFPGDGAEVAKAFAWASGMVANATGDTDKILARMDATTSVQRLHEYPFTCDNSMGMLTEDFYRKDFLPVINEERYKASLCGYNGYEFFNYIYLVSRMGQAQVVGMHTDCVVLPMTPEYIAAGLALSPRDKIEMKLHKDIIARFQPAWAEVPFFDQLQNKVDRSRVESVKSTELVFEGERKDEFFDILGTDRYFGPQYALKEIRRAYAEKDRHPGLLHAKAFSLIYRAAFVERIDQLNRTFPPEGNAA